MLALTAPEASKRSRSNLSRTRRTSCSQITDSTASRCAKYQRKGASVRSAPSTACSVSNHHCSSAREVGDAPA
jgi:hypothetical protein